MAMREIKFRAWLKAYRQMTNVLNIDFKLGAVHIPKVGMSYSMQFFEDVELMQYTGLKDKNGFEIYEGDIVKFEVNDIETKPFLIAYDQNDCSFSLFRNGKPYMGMILHQENDIVIIGNIYENTELLNE